MYYTDYRLLQSPPFPSSPGQKRPQLIFPSPCFIIPDSINLGQSCTINPVSTDNRTSSAHLVTISLSYADTASGSSACPLWTSEMAATMWCASTMLWLRPWPRSVRVLVGLVCRFGIRVFCEQLGGGELTGRHRVPGVSGQGHAAAVVVPGGGDPVGMIVAPRIRALWDPQVGGAERLREFEGCLLDCG